LDGTIKLVLLKVRVVE